MSRVPPFIVGLIVSQAGYVYLSDRLVTPRNRLIQSHFEGDSATYQPALQADIRRYLLPLVRAGSGSSGGRQGGEDAGASVSSAMEKRRSPDVRYPNATPSTDHALVARVHKAWNAAIVQAVDKMAGAIYGGGDYDEKTAGNEKLKENSK